MAHPSDHGSARESLSDRAPRQTDHPGAVRSDSDDAPDPRSRDNRPGGAAAAHDDPRRVSRDKSLDEQLNESGQTEADGQGGSTIGVSDR
jgi:hypothetical protein